MSWTRYQEILDQLQQTHHYRKLTPFQTPQSRMVTCEGRQYLNFSSNNYLALAEDLRLKHAVEKGIKIWGVGSGASRLVNSFEPWHQVEVVIAKFKSMEAALVFNSGYQANLGALSCLLEEDGAIFSDALNHASMIDGMRLSHAKRFIYRHNDLEDLEAQIKKFRQVSPQAPFLIASEAVFSMDDDLCPLSRLLDLAETWEGLVYLDEAHATGVMGKNGAGLSETVQAHPAFATRLILMGTFGKALGSFGAYVATSKMICDFLINKARSFIYSTALPPAWAFAVLEALKIVQEEPKRRERLQNRIAQARELLTPWLSKSCPQKNSDYLSPIIPLIIGDAEKTLQLSKQLKQAGLWVQAIRPPTVAEGTSRLRVTLMATHTEEDLQCLVKALEK